MTFKSKIKEFASYSLKEKELSAWGCLNLIDWMIKDCLKWHSQEKRAGIIRFAKEHPMLIHWCDLRGWPIDKVRQAIIKRQTVD